MISLIAIIIGISTIILGIKYFSYIFNHLSLYALIWMVMVVLFQMKLIKFSDLGTFTWLSILFGYTSFLFGNIIYISLVKLSKKKDQETNVSIPNNFFYDLSTLKIIIIVSSAIGLFGALQHWYILFKTFGSIAQIFISANIVYQVRVHEGIPGVIPYISAFNYVGIFFSGIYSAKKNRFAIISLLPLTALILKTAALFGRAGMLMGLVLYISTFLLYRLYLLKTDKEFLKLGNKKFVLGIVLVLVIIVSAASGVKYFRHTVEDFNGTSASLRQFEDNILISPSIYLYLCSHIAVFDKYLKFDRETANFGENSFRPIYNILSKYDLAGYVSAYSIGYFIPMWSNTGTWLRELHADFGFIGGIFIVPFLFGFLLSSLWKRFFSTGSLQILAILVFLYMIIIISFLTMISRQGDWFIAVALISVIIYFFERIEVNKLARESIN